MAVAGTNEAECPGPFITAAGYCTSICLSVCLSLHAPPALAPPLPLSTQRPARRTAAGTHTHIQAEGLPLAVAAEEEERSIGDGVQGEVQQRQQLVRRGRHLKGPSASLVPATATPSAQR